MAESRSTSPSPDDMHWGISYLREDLQDVKQDIRDLRKEFQQQFAQIQQQFAEVRAELQQGLRHNLLTMIAMGGVYTGIIIAFLQYRLPAG